MRAAKKDKFLCRVQQIMIERRHKMRILYFFMVVCLVLTFGCAGMKPERTVLQDNVFYSSTSPKIKIKIHSDFKYIGKAEKHKWSEGVEKTATTHFEGESYLFGHIEHNKIVKGVVIRIFTLGETNWYWLPDLFSGVKDKLDSGEMKIQGKRYQRIVFASRLFSKDEAAFISDKQYIIPRCFLVKGLGRIVSADERTKMYIFYIEDIRHIHGNKYSCRDWLDKYMLTNEQQELLKGFIHRSEKNFQILGKKEVAVLDAESYFNRGYAYEIKGQYDKAISDYNKAIEIDPGFGMAYNNRGHAYEIKGQYEKAFSDYNKAIEINPRLAYAYNNRGNAYGIKGQYEKAISDFNKAIEINPRLAYAYNNRGYAYYKKGQYDKAISDYNKAIEIDPGFGMAYNNRGYAYYEKGQYGKAISDFTKANEINPRFRPPKTLPGS